MLLLISTLALVGLASPDNASGARPKATPGISWHEGADGFITALDEAIQNGKPLAVYFYTDWCGYCRQLERELLFRPEVEEFLSEINIARINPEKGQQEQIIAQQYGVSGYPSFFVHPGRGQEATRLPGRVKRNGRWEMQTPDEFVATIQGLVERASEL
jgi:thiol:disulfide interchange protein